MPPRPRAPSRPSRCRTPGATTARCSRRSTPSTASPLNELNPDGSSQQEIDAITANKDNKGPAAPDVIDVGLSYGPQAQKDGLVQPYKVSTWDTIPDAAKDADGNWYGDYYGVLAFEVNTAVVKNVPKDWADLLKPEYKGQVALSGDPTGSNQAISGVWAAGIAASGSRRRAPRARPASTSSSSSTTPATSSRSSPRRRPSPPVRRRSGSPGPTTPLPTRTRSPATRRSRSSSRRRAASAACTSRRISAYAPHPNAAKLWMEFLYSDEGQNIWLKGYCNPIRYDAMVKAGTVDAADVAGQTARHEGRLPADARPDHNGHRHHHQGLADDRRRHGQVDPVREPRSRMRERPPRSPWTPEPCHRARLGRLAIPLELARPRAVPRLRDVCSCSSRWATSSRAASRTRTASSRSRTTPTCPGRVPINAYITSIEISLVTAILGGLFGFLLAYAVDRRRRCRAGSGPAS